MTAVATPKPVSLRRRARLLVWATIAWNGAEAVIALLAGAAADSGALVSFGLDSIVEVSAALVALWYLRGQHDDRGVVAGRFIALSFWALASWVSLLAVGDLFAGNKPEHSVVGIVLTSASLIVMPWLALAKRQNGETLASKTLVSESKQTAVCAYLSGAVLVGLGLNAFAGLWWADSVAALVVAAVAAREGIEAWRGELLTEQGCCG